MASVSLAQPPLILIHGMWSNGSIWNRFGSALKSAGYHVIAPTLPGHGPGTNRAELRRLEIPQLVSAVGDIVGSLSDRPVLIGHSIGAIVALMQAVRKTPRAVVLINPSPPSGIVPTRNPLALAAMLPFALRHGLFAKISTLSNLESRSIFSDQLRSKDQLGPAISFVPESSRIVRQAFWFLDPRRATVIDYGQVTCPVLVIAGSRDLAAPPAAARRLAARLPNSAYHVFDGHGHGSIVGSDWQSVADYTKSWIGSLEQPGAMPLCQA